MAGQAGFEPATLGFGVRCSVQLELLTLQLIHHGSIRRDPDDSIQNGGSARISDRSVFSELARFSDLALFVERMGAAEWTEFLDPDLVRLPFLVLGGGVVTPFATVARQTN